MRHVFDQNGIKGAIAAVAKLPDNAVSISQDAVRYSWMYMYFVFFSC